MNHANPYAPPRAAVSDVGNDASDLELAGRGVRLGAALLDGLIFWVIVLAPLLWAIFASFDTGSSRGAGIALLLFLAGMVLYAWFNALYVIRNGQSIAKKWLGIKVVRADGSPASLGRIFWLRNVVNHFIGIAFGLYWLIDALVIFGDAQQCVHDKIADTIVVVA